MTNLPRLIIFDRDDTLIKNKSGHLYKVEDIEWFEGAEETINILHEKGFLIAVATNQGGVAKGIHSEEAVREFHDEMNKSFKIKGAIDLFVYCPHHPDGKIANLSHACNCRKPAPGMLFKILKHFDLSAEEAVFFGDSESDLTAGRNASIETILVTPGCIREAVKERINNSC